MITPFYVSNRLDSNIFMHSKPIIAYFNLWMNILELHLLLQTLEQERDRAENRLKVEQTQRDSIQKLRERNAQLESQLQELCKLQVPILLSYIYTR